VPNKYLTVNVYERALERIREVYREGRRVVVMASGGKDSTVVMNLALIVAREFDRLPLQVVTRDEEVMFPGTYEYLERAAQNTDIEFHWQYSEHAVVNICSRTSPFWWTFDSECEDKWLRRPPSFAEAVPELFLDNQVAHSRFEPVEGAANAVLNGVRAAESRNRRLSIYVSKGFRTKVGGDKGSKAIQCRPIFDWKDSDVWKAIRDFKWDYNRAYDTMYRLHVPRQKMRIGPPTMNSAAVDLLAMARAAWPKWFDMLCVRLDGVRQVALFGRRAVQAERRLGETWEECFTRCCIKEAPDWIAERCESYIHVKRKSHALHSKSAFPDAVDCQICNHNQSWKRMCKALYMGDPHGMSDSLLPDLDPHMLRPAVKVKA